MANDPLVLYFEVGQVLPVLAPIEGDDVVYEEQYQVTFNQPVQLTKKEYLRLLVLTKNQEVKMQVVAFE